MIRFFGGKVLALNGNFDITNDEVWIDANKIVYVGPKKDVEKFEREINLNGNLLMPTFKNAHTHSAMTFGRSFSDDLPLDKWLNDKIFPIEAKLESEDIYKLSKLAFLEYLTSGTSACFDMYYFPESMAKASVDFGFRTVMCGAVNNFKESVEKLFEQYPNKIACLVVEPVAANMGVVPPKDGFLQFLRDITEKNGTVLIFDEVITGFRLSLGGACQYFGIKPDMVTMGKIIGGGMPVGAYGGRKDIMKTVSPVGKVYQAGTLSGNPIAVTAGIETLKILFNDTDIYNRIDKKGSRIEEALKSTGKVTVNRVGSLLSAFFTHSAVTDYTSAMTADTKAYAEYFSHMLESGIYTAPSQFEAMFVSDAHTDIDIEKTCDAIKSF